MATATRWALAIEPFFSPSAHWRVWALEILNLQRFSRYSPFYLHRCGSAVRRGHFSVGLHRHRRVVQWPVADEGSSAYHDDWHNAAEWRVSAGRYWTPHFKTEVEFGATGEGSRYIQRFATVPGSATPYPYGAQEFVRLRQGSARVTWQFLDNQWIHPYLSAGVSVDDERTRTHVFSQVFYPDPRNPATRVAGAPEHDEGPTTIHRAGVVLGGGAKWYSVATRLHQDRRTGRRLAAHEDR